MFSPHCCGFYCFTGVIFMTFVWVMLTAQPEFITGLEDIDAARSNAFGALITFGVVLVACGVMIMKNKGEGGREYDSTSEDYDSRLNIDLKKNYNQSYGSVPNDSY